MARRGLLGRLFGRAPSGPSDPQYQADLRSALDDLNRQFPGTIPAIRDMGARQMADVVRGRMSASSESANTMGQMWGWGWPRGTGAKWPGGLATPYGGVSINHWQLRQQARDIAFDAPHARALIKRTADSMVGTGLVLEPTPRADILGISPEDADTWAVNVRQRYSLWCKSKKQNRSQQISWHQAQHLLATAHERDNDEFVRLYYSQNQGLVSPLQFEIIDPNMIRGDAFTVTNIIGKFPDGITRNADGSEKSYRIWVQRLQDDEYTYGFDQVDIPRVGEKSGRVYMLHAFSPEYAGQGRGFSAIGSIVQELELIEDAILSVAKKFVNQSQIPLYVKPSKDAPASNPLEGILQEAAGPASFALGIPGSVGSTIGGIATNPLPVTYTQLKEASLAAPGSTAIFNLSEGEDLVLPTAEAPAQFKEFVMTLLGIISSSSGMPLEILLIAFNSNYSASRGALLVWEEILKLKRQDFDQDMESPMYEMWLSCEIAAGRIACPGWNDPILRAAWTAHRLNGAPMPNIDPNQTADADLKYVQMNAQTLDDVARNLNGSSAKENAQRNKALIGGVQTWPWQAKVTEQGTAPAETGAKPPPSGAPTKSNNNGNGRKPINVRPMTPAGT